MIDAQLIKQLGFADDHVFMSRHIFSHLKLELALAIPALNERKIETDNSGMFSLEIFYVSE